MKNTTGFIWQNERTKEKHYLLLFNWKYLLDLILFVSHVTQFSNIGILNEEHNKIYLSVPEHWVNNMTWRSRAPQCTRRIYITQVLEMNQSLLREDRRETYFPKTNQNCEPLCLITHCGIVLAVQFFRKAEHNWALYIIL